MHDRGEGVTAINGTVIGRIPRRENSYPCSHNQVAMWMVQRLDPRRTATSTALALRLLGGLDRAALAGAVGDLVARHEVLRTTFVEIDGEPRQVVHAAVQVPLVDVDLGAVPAPERAAAARAVAARACAERFDLGTGPLVRAWLVRLTDTEHILLTTWHHMIVDGLSMPTVRAELAAHYARRIGVAHEPPPDPPIQYVDFAAWQRARAEGGDLAAAADAWRARRPGPTPDVVLPCVAPPGGPPRGAKLAVTVPADVARRLAEAAKPTRVTPYHLVLTGFAALLARYCGGTDVAVGALVTARTVPELESLVGDFVNVLPVRVTVVPEATFRSLIGPVRAEVLHVLANRDVPYALLRAPGDTPPRYACLMLPPDGGETGWAGLVARPWYPELDDVVFELSLVVRVVPEGLSVTFEYRADIFGATTVRQLADHFVALLTAMAEAPDSPVDALPMLSPAEHDRVHRVWNRPVPAAAPPGVLTSIAAVADRKPGAPALVGVDGAITTYGGLLTGVYALAARVRAAGVPPGVPVGVYLERSPPAVLAVLGVLAAGAAYLPMSVDAPPTRSASILADAGVRLVLTTAELAGDLPPHVSILDLSTPDVSALDVSTLDGFGAPDPGAPAYVVYTSGSTGAPKGVVVTHGNLAAVAAAWRERFGLMAAPPRLLQVADLAFDVFTGDVVRALTTGGALVFCARDVPLDPAGLYASMVRRRVTAVDLVPAVARRLAAYLWATGDRLDFLDLLVVGSDRVCIGDYADLVALAGPGTRVVNAYGVTEATIDSVVYRGPPPDGDPGASAPIGRPLPGTTAYVLDRHLRPCPVAVTGELYLGGRGVAAGYLGDPGLTAARFLPDPFDPVPGRRLYRTGDLARWHPDGVLEVLGRVDDQVKINGRRIEPAEVAAAVRELPGVADAVVIAWPPGPGERRLVAYVVRGEGELDLDAAPAALRGRLPDHLVPATFVVLPGLPLGATGKVDRSALPPPPADTGYVAPRDATERVIAEIWAELLGVPRVGAHDGFVALGGHSMLAARLAARLRAAFGVDLSLRAVLAAGTVAAQARAVAELLLAEVAAMSDDDALRLLERG